MPLLLCGDDIDRRLNWTLGKADRMARRGKLPHILLPDGSIRYRWKAVRSTLVDCPSVKVVP